MPYRDRQTPAELLQAAIDWENLRAAYWRQLNPKRADECLMKVETHRLRLESGDQ